MAIFASMNTKDTFTSADEKGFALILVVFIISLATIIVTMFSTETFSFLKRSRSLTDSITADYAAHSALEVALSILEIPDDPSLPQQPWQILSAMPSLPISGFIGDVRVQVIDEDALINVNAITASSGISGAPTGGDNGPGNGTANIADFWKFSLVTLFDDLSYTSYPTASGSSSQFSTEQQIAILTDWIDPDSIPFSSETFPAKGNESTNQNSLYLNRPLRLIDELGRVPGISISFLQNAAQYLRTGTSNDYKINVNTAHPLVLKALGFQDSELNGILDKRQVQRLTPQELEILVPPSSSLAKVTTTSSNNYRIIVRSKSVSTIRWLEAECVVQNGFGKSVATVKRTRIL